MKEIDLSDIPDDLSDKIIKNVNKKIEEFEFRGNPVQIMPRSKIIILNGKSDKINKLYVELKQTVTSTLNEYDKYNSDEIDKYKDSVEFRELN